MSSARGARTPEAIRHVADEAGEDEHRVEHGRGVRQPASVPSSAQRGDECHGGREPARRQQQRQDGSAVVHRRAAREQGKRHERDVRSDDDEPEMSQAPLAARRLVAHDPVDRADEMR